MIRAPALRPGDCIGVITPSSPAHVAHRDRYLNGLRTLRTMGFEVVEGSLTARATAQGYRSGSPEDRAAELMALFVRPEVRAIIATIGGSNSASLLPFLDFDAIRAHPKVFCGYSDVSSLHMALWTQAGLSTFHGPAVVPSFGEFPSGFDYTRESFLDAVMRHRSGRRALAPPPHWSREAPRFDDPAAVDPACRVWQANPGWRTLVSGHAVAPVLCANLNTLVSLAGTRFFPSVGGHILMIEEMAAPFSRYERNLRQLQLMGVFDTLAGLVVGKPEMPDCEGAPFSAQALLMEVIGSPRYPVVVDFDGGHTHPMVTLAQGALLEVDASTERAALTLAAPMVD
jgi:muramoyltetrapeptide carboxypeptidase LdcA involved in peptidoglycan recycling